MSGYSVIRTPAFDLLAKGYGNSHPKLEDDLTWSIGRLALAPEQMGDHVPELGGLALPIFKTRCKDSCHKIGSSGACVFITPCINPPGKFFCSSFTTRSNMKAREPSFCCRS